MKVLKKVVTTTLIASMMIVPATSQAEGDVEEIVELQVPQELRQDFTGFYGKVKDIKEEGGKFSILVENENEESLDKAVFYIAEETLLLSNETMDIVNKDYLEVGMEVMAYYPSDIILPMIYPPRIPAEIIAIMENEEHTSLPLPAKATPEKVIVLEQELKDMDKVIIDNNEISLDKPMYMKEDIVMVPIRQIAEALGYEVKWNGENKSVEITKGAHFFLVKIGEDNYNFAKMAVQLGAAPELVDSTTYVPVEFLELMGFKVNILYDGVLYINN